MRERAIHLRDEPWQRLPWLVPLAVVLTVVSQMGFLSLLRQTSDQPATPRQVDMQVVELPVRIDPPAPRPTPPPPPAPKAPPPKPIPEQLAVRSMPPPAAPVQIPSPAPVEAAPPPPAAATIPVAPESSSSPSAPVTSTPPPALSAPAAPSAPPPVAALPPSSATGSVPGGTDSMSARAIYKPMPEIPESLRRRNVELVAVARFRVTATGTAAVELVEPTTDAELNRALLETLGRWRFFPATQAGRPVTSTIDIRIPISVR